MSYRAFLLRCLTDAIRTKSPQAWIRVRNGAARCRELGIEQSVLPAHSALCLLWAPSYDPTALGVVYGVELKNQGGFPNEANKREVTPLTLF